MAIPPAVRAVVQRAAEMAVGIPCAGHAHMVRKEMRHVIIQQRTHGGLQSDGEAADGSR